MKQTFELLNKKFKQWRIFAVVFFILPVLSDILTVILFVETLIKPLMIFSIISLLCFFIICYYFFNKISKIAIKEHSEQQKNVELLEKEILQGIKIHKSHAKVIMSTTKKKYIIEILKEYKIISDTSKWLSCQFYSNNILDDAKKATDFYKKNSITWEELKVSASLKFKNPGAAEFSSFQDVKVKLVADGNNYKKYNIEYITTEGDILDIKKDTEIVLKYKYEVPIHLWGSYLNRYVSYWGEETIVKIACNNKKRLLENELKLYKTDNNGKPILCDNVTSANISKDDDNLFYKEIKIERDACRKYIVWWDANAFFNSQNLNTGIAEDVLQITQY